MNSGHSRDRVWRERAAAVIPNGMYGHESVRMMPGNYPQFFDRALGARLWDTDDNEYIDYMCAYGPNLLGYGHVAVDAAATRQQAMGDAMTGPSPVMVELAEQFVGMISHADWAMFAKNGTDVTTMAMMTARAHTGKRKILVASGAYHGAAPWCTPVPTGTTPEDRAHIVTYQYNDIDSLREALAKVGNDLAGIFVSPFKHDAFVDQERPATEYALEARRICDERGALLIVDDVRAGFRLARDCSWSMVGIRPDLSCWGKSIANGYPISALLGSDNCRSAAGSLYVTGSFWFAASAMAAAIATLQEIRSTDYLERMLVSGEHLREGLQSLAEMNGFGIRQTGPEQMPLILFEDDPDMRLGFGWCEKMLSHGIYMHPWHNMFICAALSKADVVQTLQAADTAFQELKAGRHLLKPHPAVAARLKAR